MKAGEIFCQLMDRLVLEEQGLRQWSKPLLQVVRQLDCQNGINPVILKWGLGIYSVRRHLQHFCALPAQVLLCLLEQRVIGSIIGSVWNISCWKWHSTLRRRERSLIYRWQ